MLNLREDRLVESLADALKANGFGPLTPIAQTVEPPANALALTVEFRGLKRGKIEIVTSIALGQRILQNTLGCDSSDSLVFPSPRDPLIELANVTCGLWLKKAGPASHFRSSVPKIEDFDTSEWHFFLSDPHCEVFDADGTAVAIRLTVQ